MYGLFIVYECPEVSITYFKADDKKEGGSYKEVTGIVKKIDAYEKTGLIVKSSWTLE